MKAKVAIVLLNWNGWQDTLECLDSIVQIRFEGFAIVVVDNASSDDSREKILNWGKTRSNLPFGFGPSSILSENDVFGEVSPGLLHGDFIYVQANSNAGFAAGNNLGIKLACARQVDYVWLLNNDTVVQADSLSCLFNKGESDKTIGICGSLLRFYHQPNIVQAVGGVKFDFWRARGAQLGQGLNADSPAIELLASIDPTYVSGASMLVRKAFISDVGLMEEGYFLYFEEMDWAMRSKGRWRMATASDSVVFHKEGGAIGTASLGTRSKLSQYYLNRNLIRFYYLRRPALLPLAVARVCREMLACLYNQSGLFSTTCRALFDALLGRFGMKSFS